MADVTDKDRELLASFGASELITRYGLCCWKVGEAAALKAIAQAREEGRREEREACAVIADDMLCPNAANAIRARVDATHSAADAASEV